METLPVCPYVVKSKYGQDQGKKNNLSNKPSLSDFLGSTPHKNS